MATERTLSIIKPDAVAKNVIGQIYARFESAGLKIAAARMAHLSRAEAEAFYAVHKARPFFNDLVELHDFGPGDDPGAGRRRRHRAQPRADGRHRPEEGREGHDPRRLRRQHRCQRGARLRRCRDRGGGDCLLLPGHERSTAADGARAAEPAAAHGRGQPSRLRPRRPGSLLRRPRGEALSRAAAVPLAAPEGRGRFLAHVRPGALAARQAGRRGRGAGAGADQRAGLGRRHHQVAVRRGPAAMRSRPCSSPRTTAARCACRRRPAARWAAASAPPATRASAAT